MLRSVEASSPIAKKKKIAGNMLPTTREVLEHFYCGRQLMDTDPKFLRKIFGFSDVQGLV